MFHERSSASSTSRPSTPPVGRSSCCSASSRPNTESTISAAAAGTLPNASCTHRCSPWPSAGGFIDCSLPIRAVCHSDILSIAGPCYLVRSLATCSISPLAQSRNGPSSPSVCDASFYMTLQTRIAAASCSRCGLNSVNPDVLWMPYPHLTSARIIEGAARELGQGFEIERRVSGATQGRAGKVPKLAADSRAAVSWKDMDNIDLDAAGNVLLTRWTTADEPHHLIRDRSDDVESVCSL